MAPHVDTGGDDRAGDDIRPPSTTTARGNGHGPVSVERPGGQGGQADGPAKRPDPSPPTGPLGAMRPAMAGDAGSAPPTNVVSPRVEAIAHARGGDRDAIR